MQSDETSQIDRTFDLSEGYVEDKSSISDNETSMNFGGAAAAKQAKLGGGTLVMPTQG